MKQSAGLLVYRQKGEQVEVLIVHPGGPFWAKKDLGAWSIPKGELKAGEEPLEVARREFKEEIGLAPPDGQAKPLGEVKQAGGKLVTAFMLEGDVDPANFKSNTTEIDWPPRSGHKMTIPEVDRAEWYPLAQAAPKLNQAQAEFIDRLADLVGVKIEPGSAADQPPAQPSLF